MLTRRLVNGLSSASADAVTVYVLDQGAATMTETDGSNNWLRTDVNAGGDLLATYDANSLHFQMSDWQGTRRLQTDYAGNSESSMQNLPFGEHVGTPTGATEKNFTGQEWDSESDNDYFEARYYGSTMGRFMSPDPSGLTYADQTNPQSLNLYSYVRNNLLSTPIRAAWTVYLTMETVL